MDCYGTQEVWDVSGACIFSRAKKVHVTCMVTKVDMFNGQVIYERTKREKQLYEIVIQALREEVLRATWIKTA